MKGAVVRMDRYHYACRDCGQKGWLAYPADRVDAVAMHARACSGQVGQWVERREEHIELQYIDLDDTSACPRSGNCAQCGSEDDIVTDTLETLLGVFCLRLCASCADGRIAPCPSAVAAIEKVLEHCEHLGITSEDMAAVIEYEKRYKTGGVR